MTTTPLGDLSQFLANRSRVVQAQRDLATASAEISTGLRSDIGAELQGDFARLTSVERGLRINESYGYGISLAQSFFTGIQNALDLAQSEVVELGPALRAASGTGQTAQLLTTAVGAEDAFSQVVSALNAQNGGRSPFAGAATDTIALVSAETMIADLELLVAGAPDAATMITAVDTYFTGVGGGYETTAYQGSTTPNSGFSIGDGDRVDSQVTALDPAIRRTLSGLAMATLLSNGSGPTDAQSRSEIGDQAGAWMLEGHNRVTDVRAGIGVAEARVENALVRLRASETLLGTERASLIAADPFEAAVELQSVETRLDTLYLMTARLQRLTLAEYL